ncbi:unnamed protein product, partial [Ectocarpus fasciculatus]
HQARRLHQGVPPRLEEENTEQKQQRPQRKPVGAHRLRGRAALRRGDEAPDGLSVPGGEAVREAPQDRGAEGHAQEGMFPARGWNSGTHARACRRRVSPPGLVGPGHPRPREEREGQECAGHGRGFRGHDGVSLGLCPPPPGIFAIQRRRRRRFGKEKEGWWWWYPGERGSDGAAEDSAVLIKFKLRLAWWC